MKLLVLLSLCAFSSAMSARVSHSTYMFNLDDAEQLFEEFIIKYEKEYANEQEKQERLEVFKMNLELINERNIKNGEAVHGITKFADLTHEEFKEAYAGCIFDTNANIMGDCTLDNGEGVNITAAPDSFDWRYKNAVTRVKHQYHCGSCWAFSATGAIEGQNAIKHKTLMEFSEQQLVDCDQRSKGCAGGFMTYAFMSVIEKGGIELEADYKYDKEQNECRFDQQKAKACLTSCIYYKLQDEEVLKSKLIERGPISIALDSSAMQSYKRGIIRDCGGNKLDHGVLLVGYGSEKGVNYWIIKNSWGAGWGEKGYVRLERGVNCCSMMNPLMSSPVM